MSHGAGLAYAVSKYGVVAYSEAMRVDLEPDGIASRPSAPDPIETNLPASTDSGIRARRRAGCPKRFPPSFGEA